MLPLPPPFCFAEQGRAVASARACECVCLRACVQQLAAES